MATAAHFHLEVDQASIPSTDMAWGKYYRVNTKEEPDPAEGSTTLLSTSLSSSPAPVAPQLPAATLASGSSRPLTFYHEGADVEEGAAAERRYRRQSRWTEDTEWKASPLLRGHPAAAPPLKVEEEERELRWNEAKTRKRKELNLRQQRQQQHSRNGVGRYHPEDDDDDEMDSRYREGEEGRGMRKGQTERSKPRSMTTPSSSSAAAIHTDNANNSNISHDNHHVIIVSSEPDSFGRVEQYGGISGHTNNNNNNNNNNNSTSRRGLSRSHSNRNSGGGVRKDLTSPPLPEEEEEKDRDHHYHHHPYDDDDYNDNNGFYYDSEWVEEGRMSREQNEKNDPHHDDDDVPHHQQRKAIREELSEKTMESHHHHHHPADFESSMMTDPSCSGPTPLAVYRYTKHTARVPTISSQRKRQALVLQSAGASADPGYDGKSVTQVAATAHSSSSSFSSSSSCSGGATRRKRPAAAAFSSSPLTVASKASPARTNPNGLPLSSSSSSSGMGRRDNDDDDMEKGNKHGAPEEQKQPSPSLPYSLFPWRSSDGQSTGGKRLSTQEGGADAQTRPLFVVDPKNPSNSVTEAIAVQGGKTAIKDWETAPGGRQQHQQRSSRSSDCLCETEYHHHHHRNKSKLEKEQQAMMRSSATPQRAASVSTTWRQGLHPNSSTTTTTGAVGWRSSDLRRRRSVSASGSGWTAGGGAAGNADAGAGRYPSAQRLIPHIVFGSTVYPCECYPCRAGLSPPRWGRRPSSTFSSSPQTTTTTARREEAAKKVAMTSILSTLHAAVPYGHLPSSSREGGEGSSDSVNPPLPVSWRRAPLQEGFLSETQDNDHRSEERDPATAAALRMGSSTRRMPSRSPPPLPPDAAAKTGSTKTTTRTAITTTASTSHQTTGINTTRKMMLAADGGGGDKSSTLGAASEVLQPTSTATSFASPHCPASPASTTTTHTKVSADTHHHHQTGDASSSQNQQGVSSTSHAASPSPPTNTIVVVPARAPPPLPSPSTVVPPPRLPSGSVSSSLMEHSVPLSSIPSERSASETSQTQLPPPPPPLAASQSEGTRRRRPPPSPVGQWSSSRAGGSPAPHRAEEGRREQKKDEDGFLYAVAGSPSSPSPRAEGPTCSHTTAEYPFAGSGAAAKGEDVYTVFGDHSTTTTAEAEARWRRTSATPSIAPNDDALAASHAPHRQRSLSEEESARVLSSVAYAPYSSGNPSRAASRDAAAGEEKNETGNGETVQRERKHTAEVVTRRASSPPATQTGSPSLHHHYFDSGSVSGHTGARGGDTPDTPVIAIANGVLSISPPRSAAPVSGRAPEGAGRSTVPLVEKRSSSSREAIRSAESTTASGATAAAFYPPMGPVTWTPPEAEAVTHAHQNYQSYSSKDYQQQQRQEPPLSHRSSAPPPLPAQPSSLLSPPAPLSTRRRPSPPRTGGYLPTTTSSWTPPPPPPMMSMIMKTGSSAPARSAGQAVPGTAVETTDDITAVAGLLKQRYAVLPDEAERGVETLLPYDIKTLTDCFHVDLYRSVKTLRERRGLSVEPFQEPIPTEVDRSALLRGADLTPASTPAEAVAATTVAAPPRRGVPLSTAPTGLLPPSAMGSHRGQIRGSGSLPPFTSMATPPTTTPMSSSLCQISSRVANQHQHPYSSPLTSSASSVGRWRRLSPTAMSSNPRWASPTTTTSSLASPPLQMQVVSPRHYFPSPPQLSARPPSPPARSVGAVPRGTGAPLRLVSPQPHSVSSAPAQSCPSLSTQEGTREQSASPRYSPPRHHQPQPVSPPPAFAGGVVARAGRTRSSSAPRRQSAAAVTVTTTTPTSPRRSTSASAAGRGRSALSSSPSRSTIRRVPLKTLLPQLRVRPTCVGWYRPPSSSSSSSALRGGIVSHSTACRPRLASLWIQDVLTNYHGVGAYMPHLVWRCVEERQALEPAREEEAKVVGVDVVEMTGQGQGQGQERWYAVNLTDIVKVQVGGGDGGGGNGGGGGGLVRLPPRFLPYRDFFSTPPLTRRCQMGEMRTDGTEWAVVAPPPVGRCSTAQEEDMDLVCLVNPWGKGISAYWLAVVHFHTASSPEPPLGGPHATHGLQRPPLVVCFLTEKDRQAWVGALMGVVERNQTLHIAPQEL